MTVSPAANIAPNVTLGANVKIWAGTQIREGARIGSATSLGQYVYLGPGVAVGKNCSIQNHVQIFEPATVEDAVFIGPGVIITNDVVPRAVGSSGYRKTSEDWQKLAARLKFGCSLGAGVITVGAVSIGRWAMVAAGSVVINDVRDHELVAGSPARHIGWISTSGSRLIERDDGLFVDERGVELYTLDDSHGMLPIGK